MSELINVRMALLLQRALPILDEIAVAGRTHTEYAALLSLRLEIERALAEAARGAEMEL